METDDRDDEKQADAPVKGAKRHRSPGYPGIGLSKAIEYANQLRREMHHHTEPPRVVAQHMGFSDEKNGTASVVLSALRKFDLLEDKSDGLALTGRALDIVTPGSHGVARDKAVRECFLAPAIYKELWEKWKGRLPGDPGISYYLERERKFNPKVIPGFIKDFRDSLEFAGLAGNRSESELVSSDDDEAEQEYEEVDVVGAKPISAHVGSVDVRRQGSRLVAPEDQSWSGPSMRLDLPRGNVIEIRLRSKVTPQEFQKIKKIYELSELSFVEDEDAGQVSPPNNTDAEK